MSERYGAWFLRLTLEYYSHSGDLSLHPVTAHVTSVYRIIFCVDSLLETL